MKRKTAIEGAYSRLKSRPSNRDGVATKSCSAVHPQYDVYHHYMRAASGSFKKVP